MIINNMNNLWRYILIISHLTINCSHTHSVLCVASSNNRFLPGNARPPEFQFVARVCDSTRQESLNSDSLRPSLINELIS